MNNNNLKNLIKTYLMKRIGVNLTLLILVLIQSFSVTFAQKNKANDPKMDWWKDAKFGMFIHWGLYSIPAGEWNGIEDASIGEWIMNHSKIPIAEYKALAGKFNPTEFNADKFVLLAKEAGMKYMVLTSKHHDGFAMFKSADPFNIVDATPYKKDVVKALADACKKHGLHFGLYYSQAQDWNHPGGCTYGGSWDPAQAGDYEKYLNEVSIPQVKEILSTYNPEILWWDTSCGMSAEAEAKFVSILKKYPKLITNNRLGNGIEGDLETPEQEIPATGIPGKNWESCMTMNDTWGYKKNDQNWKSSEILVQNLVDIVSKGGNYLLNVGPTSQGLIPDASIERLKEVGSWMKLNGEAIYGTSASPFSEITWGRVTQKNFGKSTKLYLNVFDWPTDGKLVVPALGNEIVKAYPLLSPSTILKTETIGSEKLIDVSGLKQTRFATVVVLEIKGKPDVYVKPEIKCECSVFFDKLSFEINTEIKDGVVYYTTDGSEPAISSPVAKGEIVLNPAGNINVKARIYIHGKPVSSTAERLFSKEKPLKVVFESKPGLNFKYYEGKWSEIPDFTKLIPLETGVIENVSLSKKKRPINYGFVFDGFINVPETNVYTFYLTSDDGSRLILDDAKILNNDGAHGIIEKNMELVLSAGLHKISVQFFQGQNGDNLNLEWKPMGKVRSSIDNTFILH
jgi:alpha-L-fucosidase